MSKPLNAGKYNRFIQIISKSQIRDNAGFKIPKEVVILKTWANVKTTRGFTLIQNDSDFEKAYTNFTIRYPSTEITRDMVIKFNSKEYSIEYLNDVNEEHIELEIQAKLIDK